MSNVGEKRKFNELEVDEADNNGFMAFLYNGARELVSFAADSICEAATDATTLLTFLSEEPVDTRLVSESKPEVVDLTRSASPVVVAPPASPVDSAPLAIPVAPETPLPSDVQFEWPAVTKALESLKENPKAFPGHSNQRKKRYPDAG